MGEEDTSNPTPMGESARLGRSIGEAPGDVHKLPEVAHGRMLCVANGRMCYRRVSRVGVGEWICHDERHGTPSKGSYGTRLQFLRNELAVDGMDFHPPRSSSRTNHVRSVVTASNT